MALPMVALLWTLGHVQATELCGGQRPVWPNGPVTPMPESDLTPEKARQALHRLELGIEPGSDAEFLVSAKLLQGYTLKKLAEASAKGSSAREHYCHWLHQEWAWPE
ncbi:MAG: hypothetical protein ACPHCJ_06815 [Oceanococcaceae bacterium]